MRGTFYSEAVKETAAKLRRSGKSYLQIQRELSIPRSTLCTWLGHKYPGVFTETLRLEHLKRARTISASSLRAAKEKRDKVYVLRGKEMAKLITHKDMTYMKSLLAMLYWAEGTKHNKVSGLRFANTDPKMIFLYMALLRKCYTIDEKRLRLRIHVHHYHDIEKTKNYWSKLTKIPLSQTGKIWIKPRSKMRKFRQNFMGLCFICYLDSSIRKEILGFAYAIQEKIAGAPLSSFNG
ncbi:MAG: Uncharacterized protein G01um10148_135 [Parcubacteria group bacterium Gr01-1014_8]|nr:MAG: Uncharacterized protein G01um10148_135 [Parcubacteria group bacterium Gr01-1014_8]